MPLTPAEKAAGRLFRAEQAASLAALPPAVPCSPFIREYRHDCPARGGVSWPLRLKECTVASQWYVGRGDGTLVLSSQSSPVALEGEVIVRAGRFSFTWLEGHCGCGLDVRSQEGRLAVHE